MRRLARYTFTALSALSLLLCVAVCVLWVRSYWVSEGIVWKPAADPAYYSTYLAAGRWRFDRGHYRFDHAPYLDRYIERPPAPIETPQDRFAGRLGFAVEFLTDSTPEPHIRVMFPVSAPVLLTALLPSLCLLTWRNRRRRRLRQRTGLCPRCGYDLRASPGRCPECGFRQAQSSEPDSPRASI